MFYELNGFDSVECLHRIDRFIRSLIEKRYNTSVVFLPILYCCLV